MARSGVTRRVFAAGLIGGSALLNGCARNLAAGGDLPQPIDLGASERVRVLRQAEQWLEAPPITVTASLAPRSPGDRHAYYSEGDYWWPDPANPSGPFVRRDGESYPGRFDDHRQALIRLSRAVPALAAAWLLTGRDVYAQAAQRHLSAWFVDPETAMAPHLEHAQAIVGRNTGRGIGIIDTLHLAEVAVAIPQLPMPTATRDRIDAWFARYLEWMWTSPNGLDEQDERNNHGTCYAVQVAVFAQLIGDRDKIAWCRTRLTGSLVPGQIAVDGSQPLELSRTKPFGYSLFNLDMLSVLAHLVAPGDRAVWTHRSTSHGSLADAAAFMLPFIEDKTRWTFAQDVAFWDQWPVRHPLLLIDAALENRPLSRALWDRLDPDPSNAEVIRNMPFRQPLIWFKG